ncbi:hypothetical protein ACET3X_004503 [Alternaria dauci]|uniref:Uncharacterized protein n=1 Tax=Alternaria dauci TaxID=48095 RepID=A0ABR3UNN8_9PLEO
MHRGFSIASISKCSACRDGIAIVWIAAPRLRVELELTCDRHIRLLFATPEQTHAPGCHTRDTDAIATAVPNDEVCIEKASEVVSHPLELLREGRIVRKESCADADKRDSSP